MSPVNVNQNKQPSVYLRKLQWFHVIFRQILKYQKNMQEVMNLHSTHMASWLVYQRDAISQSCIITECLRNHPWTRKKIKQTLPDFSLPFHWWPSWGRDPPITWPACAAQSGSIWKLWSWRWSCLSHPVGKKNIFNCAVFKSSPKLGWTFLKHN